MKQVSWTQVRDGVYTVTCLGSEIRVIVTRQTPPTPNNTIWHFFSGNEDLFQAAQPHHQWRNAQTSTIINQMYEHYQLEGVFMSYTMADYQRDAEQFLVKQLDKYPEIVEKLSPAVLKRLSPAQRLQGLSPADIEAYLAKLKPPKSRKRKA